MSGDPWGAGLLLAVAFIWIVQIGLVVRQHDRWDLEDYEDKLAMQAMLDTLGPASEIASWSNPHHDVVADLIEATVLTGAHYRLTDRAISAMEQLEVTHLAAASKPFVQWREEHVDAYTLDLTSGTLEDRQTLAAVLREIRRRHKERGSEAALGWGVAQ